MRRQAANLLSGLRVLLAPLLVGSLCAPDAASATWSGAVIFACAAASDVVDGWVARRTGSVSAAGRWLDHGADIVFLLAGYGALVWRGSVPWWVPASIALAFGAYVADSLRRAEAGARLGSRLGHLGGVMNYVLLGALVATTQQPLLAPLRASLVAPLLWAVPVYSAAAVLTRLLGARRSASRGTGRAGV